jgi:EmrB/QacA subfamily drug resistance transporter
MSMSGDELTQPDAGKTAAVETSSVKNMVFLVATLGAFMTPFMGSSVNIALPAMGNDLSMGAVRLSWVTTAYLLTSAVFLVPFGKLADIYGRKRIFLWGVVVFTVSSLVSMLSNSSNMLIISRAIQGAGSAMMFGTSVAMISSVFPQGERGRVLGFNVAMVYIGLSCGPVIGGFLTHRFGWRSIFLVSVLIGAGIAGLIICKLKAEWTEAKGERFDLFGSMIYGVSLLAVIYGFSLLPSMPGVWITLGGLVMSGIFIYHQKKAESPIVDLDLFFKNRVFAFSNLAALINYSATFAVGFLLSLYLQYAKGLDPEMAGLILVAQPIMQAIFSPLAGKLSDRIQSQKIASAGMAMTATGLTMLMFMSDKTPLIYIIACLIFLGLGFAFFSSPNTNAVMNSVDKQFYGVASATLGTMRLTGQMFSMGIAMMIFSIYMGKVKITPEHHAGFIIGVKTAFAVFAILCAAGVLASLARGKVRRDQNA